MEVYKQRKENEWKEDGNAAAKRKVVNIEWKSSHSGSRDTIVQARNNAKQCTGCGFDRQMWAECYQTTKVSSIGTRRI